MTDPWDERYIYLHENLKLMGFHVGKYTLGYPGYPRMLARHHQDYEQFFYLESQPKPSFAMAYWEGGVNPKYTIHGSYGYG